MASEVERFYEEQREIGSGWGVVLPSWADLSWEERLSWEASLNESSKEEDHHTLRNTA